MLRTTHQLAEWNLAKERRRNLAKVAELVSNNQQLVIGPLLMKTMKLFILGDLHLALPLEEWNELRLRVCRPKNQSQSA